MVANAIKHDQGAFDMMTTITMISAAAAVAGLSIAAIGDSNGTLAVDHATMHVSADAVSAIRLPDGQKIVEVTMQDPARIEMDVANDTTIALRGVADGRGTHLLIRRATGKPLDVVLLPAAAGMRSHVTRLGGNAAAIPEWRLDGRDISVLKPGFAVQHAYASPGVRVEVSPSDGAFVATGETDKRGDVMVVGKAGEIGIYRLD